VKLIVRIEGDMEPATVGALLAAAYSIAQDPARKHMALGWETGETWLQGQRNKQSWTLFISKPEREVQPCQP
jgi:hypothetical protein